MFESKYRYEMQMEQERIRQKAWERSLNSRIALPKSDLKPDPPPSILDQACAAQNAANIAAQAASAAAAQKTKEDLEATLPKTMPEKLDPNKRGPRAEKLLADLKSHVIGQVAAVDEVVQAFIRSVAGLGPERKPQGIFLLAGPTGTGKTHLVETFSNLIAGCNPLRIDCAEYQHSHETAKLIGSPPGYLGHRETKSILSNENIKKHSDPESGIAVILLDEVDKAHPNMMDLFLGAFDYGKIKLGDNSEVDLSKTFIFMTSNQGANSLQEVLDPRWGLGRFAPRNESEIALRAANSAEGATLKGLRPEMMNRLDKILVFSPLTQDEIAQVLEIELRGSARKLARASNLEVVLEPSARELIARLGYDPKYNARHLKRNLERLLERPVANLLVSGQLPANARIAAKAAASGTGLEFEPAGQAAPEDPDDLPF